jgi:hypothetical protein
MWEDWLNSEAQELPYFFHVSRMVAYKLSEYFKVNHEMPLYIRSCGWLIFLLDEIYFIYCSYSTFLYIFVSYISSYSYFHIKNYPLFRISAFSYFHIFVFTVFPHIRISGYPYFRSNQFCNNWLHLPQARQKTSSCDKMWEVFSPVRTPYYMQLEFESVYWKHRIHIKAGLFPVCVLYLW